MAEKLQPGDVVVLKSGGPAMTIKFVEDEEAACTWFDGKKKFESRFALKQLKRHVMGSGEPMGE